MSHINLLIKPASGNCNMRCKYCFYHDVIENRETASFGMMSLETLENIVRNVLNHPITACTIAFQGGEPTLRGLEFYRHLIEYVKKYNKKNIRIHYALQTNGYIIDNEWARFFAENNFLIGLSMDGMKDTHDLHRVDALGSGTYKKVMHTIQLFKNHKVEFNILTVVTAQVARNIGKIYGFYKRNGLHYQQYIPCIDPFGEERGQYEHSLTPELYAYFLKTLFNLWYHDIKRGVFNYNRYFENLVGMILGLRPESCGMAGVCTRQYVIEADGSVCPCDFYVLDKYKIGDFTKDDIETIEKNRKELGFIEKSMEVHEKCKKCKWFALCRGGCRRDREPSEGHELTLNYFCSAYQEFFEYAYEKLCDIARMLRNNELGIK